MKSTLKPVFPALLTWGLTAAVFLPVLSGGFLSWDDRALYVENLSYTGFSAGHWQWMCSTFRYGHWQPLTWLSCALDYAAWGLFPYGWHSTSLMIHSMNAVLVYLLCLAFLKDIEKHRIAALAALLWAVHPLRVEPVAWLSTRGYLLCTSFCLLTVLFYLKSGGTRPPGALEHSRRPRSALYLTALLCFTLATFTKGIGMMLPLVLLLMDWFPLRRITSIRTAFFCAVEKIPFFALSLVTGVTAFLAKRADGGMAPVEIYGPAQRIGQAAYGICFYLLKTVAPVRLSPLYEKPPELWQVLAAWTVLTAAAVFLFLFRRKCFSLIAATGIFSLMIFPMLGITQSGSQMFADRFTYLAAVPFSVLLAAALSRLHTLQRTVRGFVAAVLLIFSLQSYQYARIWKNGVSLWTHAVTVDSRQSGSQNNLGIELISAGDFDRAKDCFDRAVFLRPGYADALNNRALVRMRKGEYRKAVEDLNAALETGLMRTNDRARMNMTRGLALEELQDYAAAEKEYTAVIDQPGIDYGLCLKAMQARARLRIMTGSLQAAKNDLSGMLLRPDPSGEFHKRAKDALSRFE